MVYAFNYFHSSCSHHLIEMLHSPFNEREDRGHEGFTRFGKGVFHAWWNFSVREYSTRGGTSAYTSRCTRWLCSRFFKVCESIF